jgi:periplasmic divalent cation tolerance protein
LAACVNIVPQITSIYTFQGEQLEESESLMIIKTSDSSLEELKATIKQLHPYKVPEILAIDTSSSDPDYLDWILKNTK